MKYLRSGTAAYVTLGPFIGSSDGFTIKNALGSTAELVSLVIDSDTGGVGTLAMDSVAGTTNGANDFAIIGGCDAGLYSFELTTANTAYVGRGYLTVLNSTHMPVWEPVHLLAPNIFDALFAGTSAGQDYLQVDARQVNGTTQTTGDLAALLVDIESKVDDLEGRTPPLAVTNGTVVADAGNSTAQFKCDLAPETADYFKNCLVLFTDGGLADQVKEISGYSTGKIISVTDSFTSEPTTGAAFSIINR
jgi:hypothetical protein